MANSFISGGGAGGSSTMEALITEVGVANASYEFPVGTVPASGALSQVNIQALVPIASSPSAPWTFELKNQLGTVLASASTASTTIGDTMGSPNMMTIQNANVNKGDGLVLRCASTSSSAQNLTGVGLNLTLEIS